jgi:aspartyl/asparaginyl beta-hydroxylase (cupin superfamily)
VAGKQEGKCVVFDDSFEHEVWHRGDERRVVLLLNIWHPAITAAQKEASMEQQFSSSLQYQWH